MTQLLEHLKVIDAASFLAAPAAGTVLADYGADVIKIEPPQGDGYRRLVGRYPVPYTWQLTSRHKRSIALDLNQEEGQSVLKQLASEADIFVCNFPPALLAKFDMNYEAIKAVNPNIIYAYVSGYGLEGPDAERRAFDATAWWARSGMMDLVRTPGQLPMMGAGGFGDHATSMSLFGAIMMALYRRERTGEGSFVHTSLLANGAWSNGMQLQGMFAGFDGGAFRQKPGSDSPFGRAFETSDGRHVVMSIVDPRKEWPSLARALGREDWLEDERFQTGGAVSKNRDAILPDMETTFASMDLATLKARLDAENIAYGIVNRISDIPDDEQMKAAGIVVPTDDDGADYQWTIASPINMEGVDKKTPSRAPDIGQNSVEVLREHGVAQAEIERLISAGVVIVPGQG